MALYPNQIILGAAQRGACSELHDSNPYDPKDEKRYLGWQAGHERVVQEHQQRQEYDKVPWFRKVLCNIGIHKYSLQRIPGRPHIDPETHTIDRRDPIIKKYTCIYCSDVCFQNLSPTWLIIGE